MPLAVLLNPDDPIYGFEHMMRHREYFAVMKPLHGFSVLPYLLDPATGTDQPAQKWNLNHQQAHNDFNVTLPANQNNGFTTTNVVPDSATAIANSFGTTDLVLTSVTGTVVTDAVVVGTGVPDGTTIIGQSSGTTGKDGTYTISQPTLLTNIPVTITLPPYIQANAIGGERIGINQPGVFLEGDSGNPNNKAFWAFLNHQQHFVADKAILPLPTTASTTAGTGQGVATVSYPWWWAEIAPINFPYW